MTFPRLAAATLTAVLALAAPSRADVITSSPTGTLATSGSGFSLGQSVTTGAGGPWNTLSFNLFTTPLATPTPHAEGTLFLLSQPYTGLASALGTATPGYIADTSTITAGTWDFADAVTLQASTQYYFYMAGTVTGAPIVFSNANPYAGGGAYQGTASDPYFAIPGGVVDIAFSLHGTPATATPEPGSALLLAPALFAVLRRRRLA